MATFRCTPSRRKWETGCACSATCSRKYSTCGSRAEIRQAVQECMDAAKAGGGYVIMPTAAPIESPLPEKVADNYLWYIESALELGAYRVG